MVLRLCVALLRLELVSTSKGGELLVRFPRKKSFGVNALKLLGLKDTDESGRSFRDCSTKQNVFLRTSE